MSRFGNASNAEIDKNIDELTPENTKKSKTSIWKQFTVFCADRNHVLEQTTSVEKIALILKDWAGNMRKRDGSFYKESVLKTMWNVTAKLIQEKYLEDYGIVFDPFNDARFKSARDARNASRKKLQSDPEKRKESSSAFTSEEFLKISMMRTHQTASKRKCSIFCLMNWPFAEASQLNVWLTSSRKKSSMVEHLQTELNTIQFFQRLVKEGVAT